MIEFVHTHRVRYGEVDPMGIVYHTHYLDFFEHARTEMLRQHGLAYKELEEAGILMPVVDLAVRYRSPAYYDDLLHVHVTAEPPTGTRIRLDYDVRRNHEERGIVTGHVTLCFVDRRRRRPVSMPDRMRDVFSLPPDT